MLLLTLWWLHTLGNLLALGFDIVHHDGMLLGENLEACLLVKQILLGNVEHLLLDFHDLLAFSWILLAHHHSHAESLHFNVDALESSADDIVHVLLLIFDHADDALGISGIISFLPCLSPLFDVLSSLLDKNVFALVLAPLKEMLEEFKLELTIGLLGVDGCNLQIGKEICFVFLAPHDVYLEVLCVNLIK